MANKFLQLICILVTCGGGSFSCSEDIPDCPSKMCILAGGWYLTEVYVDNTKENSDLSKYRLMLFMPAPATATVSTFERIQPSGTSDEGSWSIENNGTILRLIPDDNALLAEDWLIEKFSPRQLVLVLNRDAGIKDGPGKLQFILEPF
jgi:hypothetical protein